MSEICFSLEMEYRLFDVDDNIWQHMTTFNNKDGRR